LTYLSPVRSHTNPVEVKRPGPTATATASRSSGISMSHKVPKSYPAKKPFKRKSLLRLVNASYLIRKRSLYYEHFVNVMHLQSSSKTLKITSNVAGTVNRETARPFHHHKTIFQELFYTYVPQFFSARYL